MRKLDLSNQRFDQCLVSEFAGMNRHGKSKWHCLCDCGNTFIALGSELRSGHTKSCGCYGRGGTFNITHGHRRGSDGKQKQTPMYTLWINIKQRCLNPNSEHFSDYGGRGIHLGPRWENSFEDFLNDITNLIGEKPPKVDGYKRYWSLDRIDNDGNYEPGNVRWSDPVQQKANQRPRRWWKKPSGKVSIVAPSQLSSSL